MRNLRIGDNRVEILFRYLRITGLLLTVMLTCLIDIKEFNGRNVAGSLVCSNKNKYWNVRFEVVASLNMKITVL